MNESNHNHPNDPLEKKLNQRIIRTSPEFEARFLCLRSRLQQELSMESTVGRARFPRLNLWGWTAAAAVAGLALTTWIWLTPSQLTFEPGGDFAQESFLIEDPFSWDAPLADAMVLLNEDTLEALLFLAYDNQ